MAQLAPESDSESAIALRAATQPATHCSNRSAPESDSESAIACRAATQPATHCSNRSKVLVNHSSVSIHQGSHLYILNTKYVIIYSFHKASSVLRKELLQGHMLALAQLDVVAQNRRARRKTGTFHVYLLIYTP
jgi:hypothetical protein